MSGKPRSQTRKSGGFLIHHLVGGDRVVVLAHVAFNIDNWSWSLTGGLQASRIDEYPERNQTYPSGQLDITRDIESFASHCLRTLSLVL